MSLGLVIAIVLVVAFPFLFFGYFLAIDSAQRKYADPPPAVLPTTFRSDRLLVFPMLALAAFFLMISLLLLALGYLDGPWNAGMGNLMIGLLLLGPSMWFSWQQGCRMIRPDTLTLCEEGIVYRRPGRTERWLWRELSDADNQNMGIREAVAPDLYLVLEGGYTESLGNLWAGPFGMPAAYCLAKVIRATIRAQRAQLTTAQESG